VKGSPKDAAAGRPQQANMSQTGSQVTLRL